MCSKSMESFLDFYKYLSQYLCHLTVLTTKEEYNCNFNIVQFSSEKLCKNLKLH